MIDISINNKYTVFIELFGKKTERTADIIQIFKEVQMIGIYIENKFNARIEFKKTVGIFTSFCNKVLRSSDTDIAVDIFEDASDRNCRVTVTFQHDQ